LGLVASGNVQVADEHVRMEVTMPWPLHNFSTAVQKAISGRRRVVLEKKRKGWVASADRN
jgi:hypothetical protein